MIFNNSTTINFTEDLELQLFSYYKQFQLFGCTYMYYTINNPTIGRIRFTTNYDWIGVYLQDSLILDDPVKQFCEKKQTKIIHWKNIPILNNNQKKVMDGRNSFRIYNGMSIIKYDYSTRLEKVLALSTDCASYDFPNEILKNDILFKEKLIQIFSLI